MAKILKLRKEAEQDLQDAFNYYQTCRFGLGHEFLLCIEAAVDSIKRNPFQYPIVDQSISRVIVHRFPYAVYFLVRPDIIIVIGVLHMRRSPKVLEKRS
jgi:plasmid stabilization system protein ParE